MTDIRASAASDSLQASEVPPASAGLRKPSAGTWPQGASVPEERRAPSLPPLFARPHKAVPRTSPP